MKWGRILALRLGNVFLLSSGLMAAVLTVIGILQGGGYLETIPHLRSLALFSLCLVTTLLGVTIVGGIKRTLGFKWK